MEAGYLHRAGYASRTGCLAEVQKANKVPVSNKPYPFHLPAFCCLKQLPYFLMQLFTRAYLNHFLVCNPRRAGFFIPYIKQGLGLSFRPISLQGIQLLDYLAAGGTHNFSSTVSRAFR